MSKDKDLRIEKYVEYYFTYLSDEHAGNEKAKTKLEQFIGEKMDQGMSGSEIIKNLGLNIEVVDEYISKIEEELRISKSSKNLLKEDVTYLHSELYSPVEPIRCYQDEDGNTIWLNIDDYDKPTLKYEYTLDDLLKYYYTNLRVPEYLQEKERDKGSLRHMVDKFGIDIVLFCIDVANGEAEDADIIPNSPFYIQGFLAHAWERFEAKLTSLMEAGADIDRDRVKKRNVTA